MTKVLTFGSLLAVKREQLGLNLTEAMKMTGYSNLRDAERGLSIPRGKTRANLIEKYKITPQELKSCIKGDEFLKSKERLKPNGPNISTIAEDIESLIERAKELKLKGKLGGRVMQEIDETLFNAKELLLGVDILDRLL